MNDDTRSEPAAPPDSAAADRLESWKEIAGYLRRDVRTVQRWERREGLPVHRHLHNTLGTVYAFRRELDAWEEGRRSANRAEPAARARRWRSVAALASVLAGAGALTVWLIRTAAPVNPSSPHATADPAPMLATRRVWTGEGVPALLSVSADGRFLSFPHPEHGDIAVYDAMTRTTTALTGKRSWLDSPGFARQSAISADGNLVAYSWGHGDGRYELWTVSRTEPQPRALFRSADARYLIPSGWSPDGRTVLTVVSRTSGLNDVMLASTADGSVRVLKTIRGAVPSARFSPDGRLVASDYPANNQTQHDIFLLSMDGNETRVVEDPAEDYAIGWTPDGRGLLFSSDRLGTLDLWLLPIADGRAAGSPVLVKKDLGRVTPIGVTPSGAFYYAVSAGASQVYLSALDPATGRLTTPPQPAAGRPIGSSSWPDWSPDGQHLAYVSQSDTGGSDARRLAIVVERTIGGSARIIDLAHRFRQFYALRWSPDSRFLVMNATDNDGRFGVYCVRVDTAEVLAVENGERLRGGAPAEWLPDGRVLFAALDPATRGRGLFARDLSTGREERLYEAGGAFAVSPDGRWLARGGPDETDGRSVLRIGSLGGGPVRELLRLDEPGVFLLVLEWSADSRYLFFTKGPLAPSERPRALWRVRVDGGEPEKLDLELAGLREVRMHPDGRRLAFFAERVKTEVWVMENWQEEAGAYSRSELSTR